MRIIIGCLLGISLLLACKKNNNEITPTQNPFEVMPASLVQNVLLENFTGEWCAPCVNAASQIQALQLKYGVRLKVVNIHYNDWLEISYGNYLAGELGGLINIPRAAVNRSPGVQTFNGADDQYSLLAPINWDNAIRQQLMQPNQAPVAIALSCSGKSNNATVTAYIAHPQNINANTRIGLYIIDKEVQAIQQQGANSNYKHAQVLVDNLGFETTDTVSLINEENKAAISKKTFAGINLSKYDLSHIEIVVLVYTYDIDYRKMKILNVQNVLWGGNKYWDTPA